VVQVIACFNGGHKGENTMAHFAEIDSNNVVLRVLVVPNEHESNGQEYLAETVGLGGTWIQTSYNASIRGKYAGIGDIYDEVNDEFYTPVQEQPLTVDSTPIEQTSIEGN
jgi:hypothetical protein